MSQYAVQPYDENAFADPVGLETLDRICPKCGKTKPSSAFRSNGASHCEACVDRGRAKTLRIRKLKAALIDIANRQIVSAARGDSIDAPRISHVCAKMVELFGGIDGFCGKWYENIQAAIEGNPGGKNGLDQLRSIAKLIKDSTSSVDAASSVIALTEEELNSEIDSAISRIVTEQTLTLECESEDDDELEDDDHGDDN